MLTPADLGYPFALLLAFANALCLCSLVGVFTARAIYRIWR
jgi:hypothetical protein